MLTFHSCFHPVFHSPLPLVLRTSCQTWMNVEDGLFLSLQARQCTIFTRIQDSHSTRGLDSCVIVCKY